MELTPKITIALAVYNQQACIRNSIQRLLKQTVGDMEILCIDDGSTDGSLDIMKSLAATEQRIRIVAASHAGVSAARNRAIDEAHGEWLIFHDPDDSFANDDSVAKLLSSVESHNEIQVVGGSFSIYDEETDTTRLDFSDDSLLWGYTLPADGVIDYADYQFDYGFHRFMFRTEFLKNHEDLRFPPYTRYQDPPFLARALFTAKRFMAVHDVVYRYSLGHQEIQWTAAKKLGVLNGLTDELALSDQYHLAKLHDLAIRRLEKEYAGLYWWMLDEDPDILGAAVRLNALVRESLLSEEMRNKVTDNGAHTPLTFPLRQQIANSAKWHEDVNNLQNAVLAERRDKERAWKDNQHIADELAKTSNALVAANNALTAIKKSVSFRVGRLITAPLRALRDSLHKQ